MAKTRIPKNLSVAELNKLQPGKGTAAQKSRIQRLLGNPGTRHLLADRFLTPGQQQTRKTNTFNAAPVVPGSTVTNKDLIGQRNAAAALKYGGAEAQAGRDIASRQAAVGQTGGYFDNYLAELRAHEANQAQINAQSQAATQGLAGSIQGLAQGDAGVVAQGNQSLQAATGAAPAAVTQDASNASMLRQALTASFGAMLAGQGANASGYADTLAHVVGPGQKLQGLTRAQGDVTKAQQARSDLAKEKGSFEQQFEDEFKQNEAKNVLAGQIAQVNTDQKQQALDIQRGNQKIAAAALDVNASNKQATTPEAKEAAKYGRSLHDWRMLGPTGRQAVKDAQAKKDARNKRAAKGPKAPDVITSGAFAGYTKDQVAKLPQSEKNRLLSDYNRTVHPGAKGKNGKPVDPGTQYKRDFRAKYGVDPVGTPAINRAKSDISRAQTWLRQLGGPTNANGQLLSNGQAAGKNPDGSPRPAVPKFDPLLVRVAMDIAQYGGILPGTADRLHHAGYSTKTLGLKPGRKPKPYTPPPANTPAGQIPGVGGN
jgi:hypothetical protein